MRSTPKQVRCRIERTLVRLRFDGIDVTVEDDGNVHLLGIVESRDARCRGRKDGRGRFGRDESTQVAANEF